MPTRYWLEPIGIAAQRLDHTVQSFPVPCVDAWRFMAADFMSCDQPPTYALISSQCGICGAVCDRHAKALVEEGRVAAPAD